MSKTMLIDGEEVHVSTDPLTPDAFTDAELLEMPRADALEYLLHCMRRAARNTDTEGAYNDADRLMVLALRVLGHDRGYEETVECIIEANAQIDRWYS